MATLGLGTRNRLRSIFGTLRGFRESLRQLLALFEYGSRFYSLGKGIWHGLSRASRTTISNITMRPPGKRTGSERKSSRKRRKQRKRLSDRMRRLVGKSHTLTWLSELLRSSSHFEYRCLLCGKDCTKGSIAGLGAHIRDSFWDVVAAIASRLLLKPVEEVPRCAYGLEATGNTQIPMWHWLRARRVGLLEQVRSLLAKGVFERKDLMWHLGTLLKSVAENLNKRGDLLKTNGRSPVMAKKARTRFNLTSDLEPDPTPTVIMVRIVF